jgi:hypothetical protein
MVKHQNPQSKAPTFQMEQKRGKFALFESNASLGDAVITSFESNARLRGVLFAQWCCGCALRGDRLRSKLFYAATR